jgi:DNA glycosylase AlkZ-like
MDTVKLRAWWAHRQGLDGAGSYGSAAEILERTGWARSVGGCGPYLTLFARGGVGREAVDAAVARLEIHELPSARGCTYVLPASDFALGLAMARGSGDGEMKVAEKLGVTAKEIDKLCGAVMAALGKGPLDPDGLREAAGGAVRNLGEEGKKKGLTTTLPVALGRLQTAGEIRRVPVNGRLDQQRYKYTLWRPNPLAGFSRTAEEAHQEMARRFFAWIGPATVAEFQAFAGITAKAAKAAVGGLKLEAAAAGDESMMPAADRAEFEAFRTPKEPQYVMVSNLDSLFLLRRDLKSLFDAKDLDRQVADFKGMRAIGQLSDLPSPAILDRGRIVGLWEYDPETESIAWTAFVKKDRALTEAVARTEEYVRSQLGDARSFSLDSPKSRAPRIGALRGR